MNGFHSLSEQKKGVIALVFLAFVFATMGIYARYLQTDFALFQQVYLRVFGAVLLGTVLFWSSVSFRKFLSISKKDWTIVVFRALTFGIGVILFTLAFITTKYSNATFVAVIPLLPLFGYFLLGEKISGRKLLYITLAFLGVALIAIHDFTNILAFGRGELYALLSAVAFNLSYVARKWQSEYLNDKESVILVFFLEGLFIFVSSFLVGESLPSLSAFSPPTIFVIVVASLANVANLFLVNYGFGRVEVSVAGNILTLETAFALLFGLFIYHEIPALRELLGGAVIIFSVYQMNRLINSS